MENVNLAEFAGGQLQQKFNMAFVQVLSNLQDPNTPFKNKRKIGIEVTFEQNESRNDIAVGVSVTTKLASVSPSKTSIAVEKDLDTGEIFFQEYGSQIRGQMKFSSDSQQNINVEGNDETEEKVLDLRKAK